MKQNLYLSGPDTAIPHNQTLGDYKPTNSWRSAVFHFCLKHGIQVINPLTEVKSKLNTNGKSFLAEDRTRKEVEKAFSLIDRCDFVLTSLYSPDESSWIPLVYAHNKGKHTIVWTPFPLSPWLASYSKASFERLESAFEYLISKSQHDQKSIIDWSIQYENSLKEKSGKFPIEGETDFQYFPGEQKKHILLMAPHATSYWHLGSLNEAENYTGALTAAISRLVDCQAIISSYCNAEDSLYTLNNLFSFKASTSPLIAFSQKMVELNKVKLIIIVRSKPWSESRNLTVNINSLNSDHASRNQFKKILEHKTSIRQIESCFKFMDEESALAKLEKFFGIPIVEINIHKSFLIPEMQRANYNNLISALEEIMDEL